MVTILSTRVSTMMVTILSTRLSSMIVTILSTLLIINLSQALPPSLAGDTRVNKLLSINHKRGGLRMIDPASEIIREEPPGSGRIVPVSDDDSFSFLQSQEETNFLQDLTREDQEDQSGVQLDYQPRQYSPPINARPALGGPLVQLKPQNVLIQSYPSLYPQTHPVRQSFGQQQSQISFFNLDG